jgi:hypothetical protein
MIYLQDFASNDFQANLVELSKEKMIQIEGKIEKKFIPLPESQFCRIKAREKIKKFVNLTVYRLKTKLKSNKS